MIDDSRDRDDWTGTMNLVVRLKMNNKARDKVIMMEECLAFGGVDRKMQTFEILDDNEIKQHHEKKQRKR